MAIVRLSGALRSEIINNVQEMFSLQTQAILGEIPSGQVFDAFYNDYFSTPQRAGLLALTTINGATSCPDEVWVLLGRNATVRAPDNDDIGDSYYFVLANTNRLPCPANWSRTYKHSCICILPANSAYALLLPYAKRIAAVMRQSRGLVKMIENDLFEKCVTLNQLVEAWPTVTDYVNTDRLERLYSKQTRKKIEASDELKQALLVAKLSTPT